MTRIASLPPKSRRSSTPKISQFDEKYYRRFYNTDPVHTRHQISHLAQAVDSLCSWWGVNIRSVLDVGSGPGYWRDWFVAHRPAAKVVSTDISDFACEKFGHQKRDISKWKPSRSFDLVVCHGVLQYLDHQEASAAIENLAWATRHVLYLEVPTTKDLQQTVDRDSTDLMMYSRTGRWYQNRLRRHFEQAGSGLWIKKAGQVLLYELEGAP